jgi:hypothetical protein
MRLKYHQFSQRLLQRVIDKIKSYEKLDELKFSSELAIEIAKFINKEILDAKNISESKVDRTEILIQAFKTVFNYTDAEVLMFESNIIEFLIDKKLIKKIGVGKKIWRTIRSPLKVFFSAVGDML